MSYLLIAVVLTTGTAFLIWLGANWIIDDGNVDKIPAKIMIEIPLPTPNCVI
jgi:hypothetical protein